MSRESDYDWRALDRTPAQQGLWEDDRTDLWPRWWEDIKPDPRYL